VQAVSVEEVDVVAVGLDEVGLVDAGLLVVGARIVTALGAPGEEALATSPRGGPALSSSQGKRWLCQ
jgi:hypothetical protein